MSRRMLVPIVIILGLCGSLSTSLGLIGGPSYDGQLDLNASTFNQLRSRLTARLSASHMHLVFGDPAACSLNSSRLAIIESETCVYAIQPDKGKTRRLSLTLSANSRSVRLVLVQPDALSIDQILKAGDSIDLDFFKNDQNQGSELTIKECVVARVGHEENGDRLDRCVLEIKN